MIKHLKSRIFFLIMICLSTIILGTIIILTILNYNNTINTATSMMGKFLGEPNIKKGPDGKEERIEPPENNIDGIYYIIVEDSKVMNKEPSYDKTIERCAIKVSNKNSKNGIIDKYVYRVNHTKENGSIVMLMENEEVVIHIRTLFTFSILASCISLVAIYAISKKLSDMLVKPIQETLEKQRQFISDASHELKTPLAVIEANADVLENEVGANKWLTYIQNEIESMNKLVNELLLLAKMENIENAKNYEKFNISEEVEIMISMFESMAYEKNVSIKSNIQKDIYFNGDKEDIKHIISTLVDNAIKHTKPNKEIEVELTKEKSNLIMQVKNMGEPIPKEEKDKIFERFYRIDKSRNRNEKRYGLGLAIAKSTVQKYNGQIEVDCKSGFTIFKVTIPI